MQAAPASASTVLESRCVPRTKLPHEPTYWRLWQPVEFFSGEAAGFYFHHRKNFRTSQYEKHFNRFKQEDWGHTQRTQNRKRSGRDKNYKPSYFLIQESSSRSILFWTSTVGKSPTSATTFSLQLEIASKDSLSVVENTSTQAWAPARSQNETVTRSTKQLCRLQAASIHSDGLPADRHQTPTLTVCLDSSELSN